MDPWWSWSLHLPTLPGADTVRTVLEVAGRNGYLPQLEGHPSNPVLGGEQRSEPVLDHADLARWIRQGYGGIDVAHDDAPSIQLNFGRRTGAGTFPLSFGVLDSQGGGSPHLHPLLTGLWVQLADATGAVFGDVTEESTLELIWDLIPEPYPKDPPPVGFLPFPLGWLVYFDAERFAKVGSLPDFLPAVVRRTPGGAVIDMFSGWGTADEPNYRDIHVELAATGRARPRRREDRRR